MLVRETKRWRSNGLSDEDAVNSLAGSSEKERRVRAWLADLIANPPPPQTECACGRPVHVCDRDPGGCDACERLQRERRP